MSFRRASAAASAVAVVLAAAASGLSSARAATARAEAASAASSQGSPSVAYVRYTATSPSIIWIARPSGAMQRRLGPGGQPLISPAGGYYVAASSNGAKGPALLIYSTGGGSPRSFFSASQATATPLAWSPSGRYLAVVVLGTSVNSARGSGLAVIDTKSWTTTMVARGIIYGASFNPRGSLELVYASASSQLLDRPTNLRTVSVVGGASTTLTHDGRSLYPVWGVHGIIFDRERLRGVAKAPEYQLWLMGESQLTQLTALKVPSLDEGLVPLAVSSNGNRIIAAFDGEDTSSAWTIQIRPRKASQITVGSRYVQAAGISGDGARLLVDVGDFEQPASRGSVDTLAFGGGDVVKVAQGAGASWNG